MGYEWWMDMVMLLLYTVYHLPVCEQVAFWLQVIADLFGDCLGGDPLGFAAIWRFL